MMKDFPMAFIDTWSIVEALRRLGFRADDIYFHFDNFKRLMVVLRTQGKEYITCGGKVDKDGDEVNEIWAELCAKIVSKEINDFDLDAAWNSSVMSDLGAFESLAVSIVDRGFYLPALVN